MIVFLALGSLVALAYLGLLLGAWWIVLAWFAGIWLAGTLEHRALERGPDRVPGRLLRRKRGFRPHERGVGIGETGVHGRELDVGIRLKLRALRRLRELHERDELRVAHRPKELDQRIVQGEGHGDESCTNSRQKDESPGR